MDGDTQRDYLMARTGKLYDSLFRKQQAGLIPARPAEFKELLILIQTSRRFKERAVQ